MIRLQFAFLSRIDDVVGQLRQKQATAELFPVVLRPVAAFRRTAFSVGVRFGDPLLPGVDFGVADSPGGLHHGIADQAEEIRTRNALSFRRIALLFQ